MRSTNYILKYEHLNTDLFQRQSKPMDKDNQVEDNSIVEEYEGECEECASETTEKVCPICGS